MEEAQPKVPAAGARQIAAVDLGSNSFHMVIARVDDGGELTIIDRLREHVRLAEGLGPDRFLDTDAQARACACLRRFGQRLAGLGSDRIRAVGTNTLRRARNADDFLCAAEDALGHPVEIVSGVEEARLIYSGVARGLAADETQQRLVIDIGGGSTELIVGRGPEPIMMDSLHVGSVTLSRHAFPRGRITRKAIERALIDARLEFEPRARAYRALGWEHAVGASGTILAVARILAAGGGAGTGITPAGVRRLLGKLVDAGHVDRIRLDGVGADRARILPGGAAILLAALEALGIEHLETSDGALREGLLHDLVGREGPADAREATVAALARRYHVDAAQARRVETTALACLGDVADAWGLDRDVCARWLRWSAHLHEIGLDIAHSHHHRHGAYVLAHADMAGFSWQEQEMLSLLVLAHRRRPPVCELRRARPHWGRMAECLAVLLRLAVLLHRSRNEAPLPQLRLEAEGDCLTLRLPPDWLDAHPLTRADLAREARHLGRLGVTLRFP